MRMGCIACIRLHGRGRDGQRGNGRAVVEAQVAIGIVKKESLVQQGLSLWRHHEAHDIVVHHAGDDASLAACRHTYRTCTHARAGSPLPSRRLWHTARCNGSWSTHHPPSHTPPAQAPLVARPPDLPPPPLPLAVAGTARWGAGIGRLANSANM